MALSRPRVGLAGIVCLGVMLAITGCGTTVTTQDAGRVTLASPSPSSDQTNEGTPVSEAEGGDDQGQPDSDGGEDPAQDRVRTGPVAQYGGPAYGDQGTAEVLEAGLWCKTIAVFWGGDPVPEGVSFTFEEAVTDRPGLQVDGGVCGTRGADRSCLGMVVKANESGIFCSLVLRPAADFQDGTAITFRGTLECPTGEICDKVAARDVEPGPPIIVDDPEPPVEEEQPQQQQQEEEQPGEEQPTDSPDTGPSQPGEETG
ncbi:hypothetical protein JNB63_01910 [Microbacterium trichothecenolyticum]|uniref:hypothetical protein n=1 Tax=Microbacterium trichothecenolyticum TaxID=69370 RepID=UPI001C6E3521|nr:hypothetical protein [Microbacterium trichothecenolyticum]MBW9118842.1 hypothetical protein [Microbacterium trichothecenolyticum]